MKAVAGQRKPQGHNKTLLLHVTHTESIIFMYRIQCSFSKQLKTAVGGDLDGRLEITMFHRLSKPHKRVYWGLLNASKWI